MGCKRGPYGAEPAVRYDPDGVPIDPADWDVEDWRILYTGIEAIRAAIAERHRAKREDESNGR